jgi:sugar phosphate isomerase/epimerase
MAAGAEGMQPTTGLGLVSLCFSIARRQRLQADSNDDLFDPFTLLKHVRSLGAGGMQAALGVLSDERAAELRGQCEESGLFLEAMINLPKSDGELDRFRAETTTAQRCGARAVRCVAMPGRRYEQFDSLEAFRAAEVEAQQMLERAAPVAEELKLPLAVENHKDQRIDERLKLFDAIDSEYVGACVDTGNSLALLEDSLDTAQALAPWAKAVHLKDQALQLREDGFLLADIPLGQGAIDLRAIVRTLRERQPGLPMCLELLTRDPLVVPCLTEDYWRPMGDLPGRDLARTLRLVRERNATAVQQVSRLAGEGQIALEAQSVRTSLDFARDVLKL